MSCGRVVGHQVGGELWPAEQQPVCHDSSESMATVNLLMDKNLSICLEVAPIRILGKAPRTVKLN